MVKKIFRRDFIKVCVGSILLGGGASLLSTACNYYHIFGRGMVFDSGVKIHRPEKLEDIGIKIYRPEEEFLLKIEKEEYNEGTNNCVDKGWKYHSHLRRKGHPSVFVFGDVGLEIDNEKVHHAWEEVYGFKSKKWYMVDATAEIDRDGIPVSECCVEEDYNPITAIPSLSKRIPISFYHEDLGKFVNLRPQVFNKRTRAMVSFANWSDISLLEKYRENVLLGEVSQDIQSLGLRRGGKKGTEIGDWLISLGVTGFKYDWVKKEKGESSYLGQNPTFVEVYGKRRELRGLESNSHL